MDKKSNSIPTNNLIMRSIDIIYKHGGFIINGDTTYKLFVDCKNRLTLEKIQDKGIIISTFHVQKFLAILTYKTFFNMDGKEVELTPFYIKKEPEERLKTANEMFCMYESILQKDPNKILETINCNNNTIYNQMAMARTNNVCLFNDMASLFERLESLIDNYQKMIDYGLPFTKEEENKDDNKPKTNEFDFAPKKSTIKLKFNINAEEELTKAGIPFEILNYRDFQVNPAIGREKELRDIGASLLSYAINPVLIGEPGVGKTAIIEGLAYKINNDDISKKLQGKKIIKISPASIVSGCIYRGMFEERMQKLIDILKDNNEYILYIDEIHTAYKTGSSADNDNDILNILKPYIENGSIKMIGATTSEEYEQVLLRDRAFTRRLRPITVSEPTNEVLRIIIENNIIKYEKLLDIPFVTDETLKSSIINILIEATKEKSRVYNEKRYNPALVLSIIEQAFGYAAYDEKDCVGVDYIIEALNGCESIYESCRYETTMRLNNLQPTFTSKPKVIELKPLKRT